MNSFTYHISEVLFGKLMSYDFHHDIEASNSITFYHDYIFPLCNQLLLVFVPNTSNLDHSSDIISDIAIFEILIYFPAFLFQRYCWQ